MGTKIIAGRKTPAGNVEQVQNDDYLWGIVGELQTYLETIEIQRVTATGVANYLTPLHQTVNLVDAPYQYMTVWDPVEQMWITVCIKRTTISVLDAGQPEPVEVLVEMTASYA